MIRDREAADRLAGGVGPGLIAGRGALALANGVQHQIAADAIKEGDRIADLAGLGLVQTLQADLQFLDDVLRAVL